MASEIQKQPRIKDREVLKTPTHSTKPRAPKTVLLVLTSANPKRVAAKQLLKSKGHEENNPEFRVYEKFECQPLYFSLHHFAPYLFLS